MTEAMLKNNIEQNSVAGPADETANELGQRASKLQENAQRVVTDLEEVRHRGNVRNDSAEGETLAEVVIALNEIIRSLDRIE